MHSGRTRERNFMNENQTTQQIQALDELASAPAQADTAEHDSKKVEQISVEQNEGQSEKQDPSKELILGKFKSVDDLTKAYEELQKHQGKTSAELGTLRKELSDFDGLKSIAKQINEYSAVLNEAISRDKELYNTPEYFQNTIFREMYSEGQIAYRGNLDTDRMVSLLEKYVESRIQAYEKSKEAQSETQQVLDSMSYSQNLKNSLTPPKKSLDEMSDDEFKASLRKLI